MGFGCWFQFCYQFYPGRPFHLDRDPVRAFHLCTRCNSPSQIRLQHQGLSMNTTSPHRKCLTQPKKCNSRNNTPLHMENTTSPNISVSIILPPQQKLQENSFLLWQANSLPAPLWKSRSMSEFCAGTEVCNYGSSCMTGIFIVCDAVWSLSTWLQTQGEQRHDLHLYLYHPQQCG